MRGLRPLDSNGHVVSDVNQVTAIQIDGIYPLIEPTFRICAVCGEPPQFEITEEAVRIVKPCPYPDGLTTVIDLEVPSGKMIVTDDLRPCYDWDDRGMASYNSALGQAQAVKAMAAIGCAYGPVGNTCPGLYRIGPSDYIIASLARDDDGNPLVAEYPMLAGICTDLWAYSIADFEHWKSRGGNPAALTWKDSVLDVPPGTYRFWHHTGERTFSHDADELIFAHIRAITRREQKD